MQKKRKPKRKVGRKGRAIKIPADFDTAIGGFIANADAKSAKAQGRQKSDEDKCNEDK